MVTLRDVRLTALHFRALAVISHHDRMSLVTGKGQGCWASSATMAAAIGCNVTNMSTAINQLAKWGYLEIGHLQSDKRKRVYRVIFTGSPVDDLPNGQTTIENEDGEGYLPNGQTIMAGPSASSPHNMRPARYAPQADDCLPNSKEPVQVVCPGQSPNPQKCAESASQYIPLSGERNSAEAGKEIQQKLRVATTRLATNGHQDQGLGAMLAQYQREIKADPLTCLELGYQELLQGIWSRCGGNKKLARWADRLRDDLEFASQGASQ